MKPLSKVFLLTQFGKPHEWTQQYIDNVQRLGQFGWHWKIFTPNKLESKGNVEIIPMTIEEFDALIEKKCGVHPRNWIRPEGYPDKFVSDFYVASGVIFEDYIQDFDFWGMTNWDIVYGRLEKFIPDSVLEDCDIFSDDVNTINGIFSLFKNTTYINNLFRDIQNWEQKFTMHQLFGLDEHDLTEVVRNCSYNGTLTFRYPSSYPIHSHDRLEQHFPYVKIDLKDDGSLWEKFSDINPPNWIHQHKFFGREIPYLHFIRTKKWPL